MVLAKSGVAGSWLMASISAEWSAKACSKAGRKCSGLIASKGGVWCGACHAMRSGLSWFCGAVVVPVSDIEKSRISAANLTTSYITRSGFFGPFALDSGPLFGEIAAAKQDPIDELAALADPPPDRLAQRRHRALGRDPDRRRGVRRGLRRRLGARDSLRPWRSGRPYPAGGAVCARRVRDDRLHPRRPARRALLQARLTRARARDSRSGCAARLRAALP